jgi:hypothetical protein
MFWDVTNGRGIDLTRLQTSTHFNLISDHQITQMVALTTCDGRISIQGMLKSP